MSGVSPSNIAASGIGPSAVGASSKAPASPPPSSTTSKLTKIALGIIATIGGIAAIAAVVGSVGLASAILSPGLVIAAFAVASVAFVILLGYGIYKVALWWNERQLAAQKANARKDLDRLDLEKPKLIAEIQALKQEGYQKLSEIDAALARWNKALNILSGEPEQPEIETEIKELASLKAVLEVRQEMSRLSVQAKQLITEVRAQKGDAFTKSSEIEALLAKLRTLQPKATEQTDVATLQQQINDLEALKKEIQLKLNSLIDSIQKIDGLAFEVGKTIGKKNVQSATEVMQKAAKEEALKVYELMLEEMKDQAFLTRYGYQAYSDNQLFNIKLGDRVPEFFANVASGTVFSLKYRALLAFRNLVKFGPEILDELKAKLFIPGIHHYASNPAQGLQKMYYYTGNTVDLEQNLKSATAEAAFSEAQIAIDGFKEEFNDFSAEFGTRKIDLKPGSIHKAADNTDKGNHPIWFYYKGGSELRYVVNVPNTTEVIDVLLKAPYYLAHSYLIFKKLHGDKYKEHLSEFFDNALSLGCYNEKMGTIFEYNKVCRQKLNPPVPHKEQMIQQYGQQAVDQALDFYKLNNETFILDPKIIPQPNAKVNPEAWKKEAREKYIQKAKDFGYFKKTLVFMSERYRPFDEVHIDRMMQMAIEASKVVDFDDRFTA